MIIASVQKVWRYADEEGSPREGTTTYQLAVDASYNPEVVDDLTGHLDRMIRRVDMDEYPEPDPLYDFTIEENEK